jgi:hypothetical protein
MPNESQYDTQGALDKVNALEATKDASSTKTHTDPVTKTTDIASAPVQQDGYKFDSKRYPVKYKGTVIYPKEHKELIDWAQKGWGYSQVNERYNKLNADFQRLQEENTTKAEKYKLYQEIEAQLSQDPVKRQKYIEFVSKWDQTPEAQPGANTVDIASHPAYRALLNEVNTLKESTDKFKEFQQIQQNKHYDEIVSNEAKALIAKYPSYDWKSDDGDGNLLKKIFIHCKEQGISNLETGFRDYMWDTREISSRQEALKIEAEKKQQVTKAGVVQTGGASPKPPAKKVDTRGMSHQDIAKLVLKSIS